MPLCLHCYWHNYFIRWQSLKTKPVLQTYMHVTEKVICYSDCVVFKVMFCVWLSCVCRPRYALVQNCVAQDGIWTRMLYPYIFQNHEEVLTFLHDCGLLNSDMNCSKCDMRSWKYESKPDNLTGSVENEETQWCMNTCASIIIPHQVK